MTIRSIGDPLGAFTCPKCAAISTEPRLQYHEDGTGEWIEIRCDDCGFGERRPTADAARRVDAVLRGAG